MTLAGILTGVRRVMTKKGSEMAFAALQDSSGKIDLVVFPKVFAACRAELRDDQVAQVSGKVDQRDDRLSILVDSINTGQEETQESTNPIQGREVEIKVPRHTQRKTLQKLSEILRSHVGHDRILLILPNGPEAKVMSLPYGVNFSADLEREINGILNPE